MLEYFGVFGVFGKIFLSPDVSLQLYVRCLPDNGVFISRSALFMASSGNVLIRFCAIRGMPTWDGFSFVSPPHLESVPKLMPFFWNSDTPGQGWAGGLRSACQQVVYRFLLPCRDRQINGTLVFHHKLICLVTMRWMPCVAMVTYIITTMMFRLGGDEGFQYMSTCLNCHLGVITRRQRCSDK